MDEARPAATIVVARPAGDGRGIEVLLLRRSPGSRAVPGYVVFPGGTVDPADAARAARWFGSGREAARACAVRELAEESGLVATPRGIIEAPGARPGEDGFPPPPRRDLPQIGRWIAPSFMPVRFDARFFAVSSPPGLRPHPDGREIVGAWWKAPATALAAFEHGATKLAWPTFKTLEALAACPTVDAVLRLRVRQVPPPREFWQAGEARS